MDTLMYPESGIHSDISCILQCRGIAKYENSMGRSLPCSLFTLRKPHFPLVLNGERGFLGVNRLERRSRQPWAVESGVAFLMKGDMQPIRAEAAVVAECTTAYIFHVEFGILCYRVA